MSRSPEGYGSGASGIHLAAKGVEKTTNDLSLSITLYALVQFQSYPSNHDAAKGGIRA